MAVEQFKLKLAANLTGISDENILKRLCKLVKRMDKSFDVKGDFTCPGNVTIWNKVSGGLCSDKLNVDQAIEKSHDNNYLMVGSIRQDGESLFIKVNRTRLLEKLLPKFPTNSI